MYPYASALVITQAGCLGVCI